MPIENPKLTVYTPDLESDSKAPYIGHGISAGFPSPALDFMEYAIDLNKHLAERNPASTFYIRVSGNSMVDAGIDDGDLLVVDRSLEPIDGKVAICLIDSEFTVKRLKINKEGLYLIPENPKYQPIKVTEDNQFAIWGVVTYVIKKIG